jgi:PAS domain S-box-containing protein
LKPETDDTPQTRTADEAVISVDALQLLRRRAQDRHQTKVALPLEMLKAMRPEDAQLLYHELRVHQIELELQNEALRRVQLELETARERYFDLYDMAPVGYCTVNSAGQILEANLTAADLLGVPRSALIQLDITHFMPLAQRQIYLDCCALLDTFGQTQTRELQMISGGGQPIWVRLSANMARGADGAITLRVMLEDVSERVQLDAILQVKNTELERARQLADKANSAKSDFLTSMSHELRSPLNAILGFAQLMEVGSPAPTAAQKSSIDQIIHGGWYLLDLVNEILDLASIESGQLALAMASESLADLLADCQTMIEPQASASHIAVQFPVFAQPCRVLADRRRLKQVVINLLSNAIKYNRQQGTVNISFSLATPGFVRLSVQDDGHGLTPEQVSNLFQPFNRLGQEGGAQEGTGIGLAVSKRLVEMMGGRIGASSQVGVGSVFWFELALAPGLA